MLCLEKNIRKNASDFSAFLFLLIYQQKQFLNCEKLCSSEAGDKAFFLYITWSHDPWVTWLGGWDSLTLNHPYHKVILRATEPNNENSYVLQVGATLCYKLGQLCFITN